MSVKGELYRRSAGIAPCSVRCCTISSMNCNWLALAVSASTKLLKAATAASRSRPTSERMNTGKFGVAAPARALDIVIGATGFMQQGFQFVQVTCGEGVIAAQLVQGQSILVRTQKRLGLGTKTLKVHRAGHQGQIDFRGLTQRIGEVGIDHLAAALFHQLDQARAVSPCLLPGMGKVTSCHHSSPATASISSRCSRTLGTFASSSRLAASCCALVCRRARAGSLRSRASWVFSSRASKRLASSSSSRTAVGRPDRSVDTSASCSAVGRFQASGCAQASTQRRCGLTTKLSSDMPATMPCSNVAVSSRMAASVKANEVCGASATPPCARR